MIPARAKRYLNIIYFFILLALGFLFFTNDFGLVDLRKTSVVVGVALDMEEEEVVLTAQLAVPQPAENGENTKFNTVTGRGATVAEALNEVNVKTGFYPKLVFCKLILVGESCFNSDLSVLLDYFYRNEYTGLTLSVAACEGSAAELIGQQFPCGNSATDVIDKLLSAEAQASGNVATVTLKDIGEKMFSKSGGLCMPYLQNGVLEEEGSEGSSGGGSEGGSGGGSGGGSQQCEESELICNASAMFSDGYFKGLMTAEETFAYNLLFGSVRHAFFRSGEGEDLRVFGLRGCKGKAELQFKKGEPVLTINFGATTKIQDGSNGFSPQKSKKTKVDDADLKKGSETLCGMFKSLYETAQTAGCDLLGVRNMLYRKFYDKYEQYQKGIFDNLTVECSVNLKSVN